MITKTLIVLCCVLLFSGHSAQEPEPLIAGKVVLIDGELTTDLKYSLAVFRGTKSAFGGVFYTEKVYFVLNGKEAKVRTSNPFPVFEFIAGSEMNLDGSVFLMRFDKESDRRQVRVGVSKGRILGGVKIREGVPKERQPAIALGVLGAASANAIGAKAGDSLIRYQVKVLEPLKPGEYCLVRSSNSCFDFGVDK